MKKLLTSIAVAAFAFAVSAQVETKTNAAVTNAGEFDQLKAELQVQIQTKLEGMSEEMQKKLGDAKEAVVQAKKQLQAIEGPNADKETEALMNQYKTQMQTQLQAAIKAMEQAGEQVKAQVEKASEEIQKQLQDRAGELKQVQDKTCDGSGKDN